ncbi:DUF4190 domain-containing protein [Cellulosimicrobium cellulans]|uniref:DUF4190 domain-containing protein n=1 Tax=Cellulosimicrobium TaxID=157920 RepID=UPI000883325D|nr:DUF4190 domain-containing protein [Cellulosimicrobium cellulans]UTT58553.1 DUF4190 domain-containing protein [Cellulosimicrobium cellulans]SDF71842.1 hypothetical protein SAMN04487781_2363 [Cellulosimicrobium cellulans]
MSTPDQPDQNPQQPGGTPSGPPAYGAPQSGEPQQPPQAPQYGAPQAPQYGAPQAPQYGAPQAGTPSYAAPGQDPGKTMGIVGLVLSFLGCLSIVGLILSIVAFNKSKKAGYKNGLALAGIIVGAIVLVLTIIGSIVFFSTVGAVTQEVLDACSGVPSGTVVEVRGEPVTCP